MLLLKLQRTSCKWVPAIVNARHQLTVALSTGVLFLGAINTWAGWLQIINVNVSDVASVMSTDGSGTRLTSVNLAYVVTGGCITPLTEFGNVALRLAAPLSMMMILVVIMVYSKVSKISVCTSNRRVVQSDLPPARVSMVRLCTYSILHLLVCLHTSYGGGVNVPELHRGPQAASQSRFNIMKRRLRMSSLLLSSQRYVARIPNTYNTLPWCTRPS